METEVEIPGSVIELRSLHKVYQAMFSDTYPDIINYTVDLIKSNLREVVTETEYPNRAELLEAIEQIIGFSLETSSEYNDQNYYDVLYMDLHYKDDSYNDEIQELFMDLYLSQDIIYSEVPELQKIGEGDFYVS
jgi:hypothetical protein